MTRPGWQLRILSAAAWAEYKRVAALETEEHQRDLAAAHESRGRRRQAAFDNVVRCVLAEVEEREQASLDDCALAVTAKWDLLPA